MDKELEQMLGRAGWFKPGSELEKQRMPKAQKRNEEEDFKDELEVSAVMASHVLRASATLAKEIFGDVITVEMVSECRDAIMDFFSGDEE